MLSCHQHRGGFHHLIYSQVSHLLRSEIALVPKGIPEGHHRALFEGQIFSHLLQQIVSISEVTLNPVFQFTM